jgi:hypothetical protein
VLGKTSMSLDHLNTQEEIQITQVFEVKPVAKMPDDSVDECWIVSCDNQIININQ